MKKYVLWLDKKLSFSQKFFVIPAFFTICILFILAYTVKTINEEKVETIIIDIVVRQETLIERYYRQAVLNNSQGLTATRKLLLASQNALVNGGEVTINTKTNEKVILPTPHYTQEMKTLFSKQQALMEQFFKAAGAEETSEDTSAEETSENTSAEETSENTSTEEISEDTSAEETSEDTKVEEEEEDERIANVDKIYNELYLVMEELQAALVSQSQSSFSTMIKNQMILAAFVIIFGWIGNILLARLVRTAMRKIADNVHTLNKTCDVLEESNEKINGNTVQFSGQTSTLANDSQHIKDSLQSLNIGVEQMNDSIREIARNSAQASEMVNASVENTKKANQAVQDLNIIGQEISGITKLIQDITEQTNLLALNASIEAARAGDAGKGFSVVADEVKSLAKEAGGATEQISNRVAQIQGNVADVVKDIGELQTHISQISDFQSMIASAVEQQAAMTSQTTSTLASAANDSEKMAKNVENMAGVSKNNAHQVESLYQATAQLNNMINDLEELILTFTG